MAGKTEQWVLEYLLDRDELSETVVRELYEHLSAGGEHLSKTIQVRLLLRVLREHAANISDATMNAMNCLAANSNDRLEDYPPFAELHKLLPSIDLYLAAKTELVLQSLRGGPVETLLQTGNPKQLLDRHFPPQPEAPEHALQTQRRHDLANGLTSPAGAQSLLDKYPREAVEVAMLKYVAEGRAAMGPSQLKVIEAQHNQGIFTPPHAVQPGASTAGQSRKRKHHGNNNAEVAAAATITDLQQASIALQSKGGPDPFPAALQAAGMQGSYAAAVSAAADAGTGAPGPSDAAGRTIAWDSPNPNMGSPDLAHGAANMGMVGPSGEPMSPDGSSGKSPKGGRSTGGKRRRNGRWAEIETNTLIALVRQWGKGKWKKILEEGGAAFNNRSQVDLKDKWRNLERQGVVTSADSGAAGMGGPVNNGAVLPQPDGQAAAADPGLLAAQAAAAAQAAVSLPEAASVPLQDGGVQVQG